MSSFQGLAPGVPADVERQTNKGVANGYAGLTAAATVPSTALPRALAGALKVASMGDSIQFTSGSVLNRNSSQDMLAWVALLTDGRVLPAVNAGVSGNKTSQMLARFDSDVGGSGAQIVYIMGGTNDANGSVSVASYAANMIAMIGKIRAMGALPVLCTVPPNPSTAITPVNGMATRRKLAQAYNVWIKSYAEANNIPVAQTHAAVVDPTTGGYLSAYDSGDQTHPNDAGSVALAQAVATALSPYLSQWTPPLPTFQTADSPNLLANGLFLTDSNSDGKADSWTASGTNATFSIVTGDASIMGNWQRCVDAVSEGTSCRQNISAGASTFAAGDRVAFTGRFKASGSGLQQFPQLNFLDGSLANVGRLQPILAKVPSGAHQFYIEGVVPATTATIQVTMNSQSGAGADLQMAQVGLYNLTALGLP